MALNNAQRFYLNSFLEYEWSLIKEFDFNEWRALSDTGIDNDKALKTARLILSGNKLSLMERIKLGSWNVLEYVNSIRSVMEHPAPQNRPNTTIPSGLYYRDVVGSMRPKFEYFDINGIRRTEDYGLPALSAENDPNNEAEWVTKEDVVTYIIQNTKLKIQMLESDGVGEAQIPSLSPAEIRGVLENFCIDEKISSEIVNELSDVQLQKLGNLDIDKLCVLSEDVASADKLYADRSSAIQVVSLSNILRNVHNTSSSAECIRRLYAEYSQDTKDVSAKTVCKNELQKFCLKLDVIFSRAIQELKQRQGSADNVTSADVDGLNDYKPSSAISLTGNESIV